MATQIISFKCIVKSVLGKALSFSYNQDVINQLGNGDFRLMALIEGLQSVKAGEKRKISVPANGAYGSYNPSLLTKFDRKDLVCGQNLKLGSEVLLLDPQTGKEKPFRVIEAHPHSVVLDGNHPFAGLDLIFEVEIVSAREAQAEDLLSESYLLPDQFVH